MAEYRELELFEMIGARPCVLGAVVHPPMVRTTQKRTAMMKVGTTTSHTNSQASLAIRLRRAMLASVLSAPR